MKTISNIFVYTQIDWAFGSIFSGLSKYLFSDGCNFHLFDWTKTYLHEQLVRALEQYDFVLTCCDGSNTLLKNDESLVTKTKFIVVLHSYRDIFWIKERHTEYMQKHITYTVLCPWMIEEVKKEIPGLEVAFTPLGIDTGTFSRIQPSTRLHTLGYAGARDDKHGKDIPIADLCPNGFPAHKKRSGIAFEVAEKVGMPLNCAADEYEGVYRHYTLMSGWYKSVDAICVTSLKEGAGLPSLEAAASGRLVISTDVGHFDWHSQNKGGIMLPTDREEYIEEATKILTYFKNNPNSFPKACKKVQSHALENYSWDAVKHYWLNLFLG